MNGGGCEITLKDAKTFMIKESARPFLIDNNLLIKSEEKSMKNQISLLIHYQCIFIKFIAHFFQRCYHMMVSQAAVFYAKGIQMLGPRCDKIFNCNCFKI